MFDFLEHVFDFWVGGKKSKGFSNAFLTMDISLNTTQSNLSLQPDSVSILTDKNFCVFSAGGGTRMFLINFPIPFKMTPIIKLYLPMELSFKIYTI